MGIDFGGGPYSPPEHVWRGFDRDGCPECGGDVSEEDGVYTCLRHCGTFDEDGDPVEAEAVDELDGPSCDDYFDEDGNPE